MTVFADPTPLADTDGDDFRRDRYGRPLIGQVDGSKPKPYTRCSSAAKAIEDRFNLEQWAQRNVAYGLAYDSSLPARVLAIGGNPSTWGKAEKAEVGEVVKDAQTAAKAHKAADIGTALHRLTERSDRGEAVVAGAYANDLAAYTQAKIDGGVIVHPQWLECRMVCDEVQMAGTADQIISLTADSPLRRELARRGIDVRPDEVLIADKKTGQSVDFLALSASAQLAAYANGWLYDPVTDTRQSTPLINKQVGVIVHLPAGEGRCDLYLVDLVEGLKACHLANEIRDVRRRSRRWLTPAPTGGPK